MCLKIFDFWLYLSRLKRQSLFLFLYFKFISLWKLLYHCKLTHFNLNEFIMIKKKKNTFIICGKDFFKAKPEGNAISNVFNADFTKSTQTVSWLPTSYILFKILSVSKIFILEKTRKSSLSSHKWSSCMITP